MRSERVLPGVLLQRREGKSNALFTTHVEPWTRDVSCAPGDFVVVLETARTKLHVIIIGFVKGRVSAINYHPHCDPNSLYRIKL